MIQAPQEKPKLLRRGLMVSDLHLFARRSCGWECLESLRAELSTVEVLVLAGDIFDFRWTTLATIVETQRAAVDFLRQLAADHPRCQIHYLLGNHDCLDDFSESLAKLSASMPQFHCHEYTLMLGSSVFLHGDCANWTMDASGLKRLRAGWKQDRRSSRMATGIYLVADRIGLTRLIHQCAFPRRRALRRIGAYLDSVQPGWRARTRHCYFGHTHLPFTNYEHDGVFFHNPGSAMGLGFAPIFFDASDGSD